MSELIARTLGAGEYVTVKGRDYKIGPLPLQKLSELGREALRAYKRDFIDTYQDYLENHPGEAAEQMLAKKLDECSKWTLDDLPVKYVHDVPPAHASPQLSDKVFELCDQRFVDKELCRVAGYLLDLGSFKSEDYEKITGVKPKKIATRYDNWWGTGTQLGMQTTMWLAILEYNPGTPRAEVLSWPLTTLMEVMQRVWQLTAPDLGNIASSST